MNGFRCNVTGATSDVALAKPAVPRRCGADLQNNRASSVLGNCTYGAKQPIWWLNNQSTVSILFHRRFVCGRILASPVLYRLDIVAYVAS